MLEIFLNHGLSLLTWLLIIGAFAFAFISLFGSARRGKDKVRTEIEDMSKKLQEQQFDFMQVMGNISENANFKYKIKKDGGHLFVLDFIGSVDAAEVDSFRDEVTALLSVADPEKDEALIRIDSGGGVVNGYGLVASQIERIKQYKLKVTCSVDEIAASGGYMAACVGDRIIAAPFAYIGSIGVVASFPNFKEILDKIGVTYKEYTAGESKRTVSQYRDITEDQETEYIQELKETHDRFIEHVMKHRGFESKPDNVFTGKHWLASEALDLKLVDEIKTSDEYIESFFKNEEQGTVFEIYTHFPKDPVRFLDKFFKMALRRIAETVLKKQVP